MQVHLLSAFPKSHGTPPAPGPHHRRKPCSRFGSPFQLARAASIPGTVRSGQVAEGSRLPSWGPVPKSLRLVPLSRIACNFLVQNWEVGQAPNIQEATLFELGTVGDIPPAPAPLKMQPFQSMRMEHAARSEVVRGFFEQVCQLFMPISLALSSLRDSLRAEVLQNRLLCKVADTAALRYHRSVLLFTQEMQDLGGSLTGNLCCLRRMF